jgi:hypothetical protein
MAAPLGEIATPEAITYAKDRATKFEVRNPMLALIYRVVAEVLEHERPALAAVEEESA